MKSFMIGVYGGVVVALITLGIIDQISVHKRLTAAEANIVQVVRFLENVRVPVPAPVPAPVEEKGKKTR